MKKPLKKKKKVSPIPKGYPTLTPYLSVRGGADAIAFYKKAFGAKERMRMPGPQGGVGHAELEIGTSLLMLADEGPGSPSTSQASLEGTSVAFLLYVKDVDAAFERAVQAGGTGVQAPQDKFYGDRMGLVTDPFGHHWYLSSHIEDVSPKEMARRAAAAVAAAEPPPQT